MKIAETVPAVRAYLDDARAAGGRVGFVPTMGALHEGHASLIRRAREECETVLVSIFINPLQFGANEDLDAYPRTMNADRKICEDAKADVIFAPTAAEMYPVGRPIVRVSAGELGEPLCGRSRPGHFDGVATVVAKLLNIAGPCRAYFGRKDAQQLVVIRRLVQDLDLPVEVVGCDTIREADGLAMSSRNRYLSAKEREASTVLYRALAEGREAIAAGNATGRQVAEAMASTVSLEPLARLEYAACVDPETLQEMDRIDSPALLAVAAWLGNARLIDNVTATPQGAAIQEA